MHVSSHAKMRSFLRTYQSSFPRKDGRCRLLEVGSRVFHGQPSYRELINQDWIDYTGLDLEQGDNVDLVPADSFLWSELADESFHVCISGQTFEHNPFFWVTMAEVSRVLAPGGIACLIAPGSQAVHRYPLDCWRFYPDSWASLCALTGLEPLEIYFEPDSMAISVVDGHVRDSMLIARKVASHGEAVSRRLHKLTEPFRGGPIEFEPVPHREGPCVADYRKTAPRAAKWKARLARLINPQGPVQIYEPDNS